MSNQIIQARALREVPEIFTSSEFGSHVLRSRQDLVKVGYGSYMRRPDTSLSQWAYEEALYSGKIAAVAVRKSNNFVFSHGTAAFLHGFSVRPRAVHITQPIRDIPGKSFPTKYYQAAIPAEQVCRIAGLPVTSIERTVRDCTLRIPPLSALIIADQALRVRSGITRFQPDGSQRQEGIRAQFLQQLAPRQPGAIRARAILQFARGLAESPRETELRLLCARMGIPAHHIQWRFMVEGAEYFTDLGWNLNGVLIAAEYDGTGKYALEPRAIHAEKAREIALSSVGVQIVRFQAGDLNPHSLPARTLMKAITNAGGHLQRAPRGLAQLPARQ